MVVNDLKMKITDKENNQWKLNINLDKLRYKEFFNKVTILAKELEYKSNIKKLNYSIVLNAVKIPNMETGGWSNRCEDFKFVLFLKSYYQRAILILTYTKTIRQM